MADDTATAIAKLDARVGGIEENVGKLTQTVDRFVEKVDERFERVDTRAAEASTRLDEKMTAVLVATKEKSPSSNGGGGSDWIRNNLVTVALAGIGGFLAYVNSTNQSSINDLKLAVRDNAAAIVSLSTTAAKSISDLSAATSKSFAETTATTAEIRSTTANVIPRPELEARIGANRDTLKTIGERQDAHSIDVAKLQADAASMKADIERFKTDSVKREDLNSKFDEYQNRLNLLSSRVTDAVKSNDGVDALSDNLKALRAQVDEFQRKFIAIPAYPKLSPYGADEGRPAPR